MHILVFKVQCCIICFSVLDSFHLPHLRLLCSFECPVCIVLWLCLRLIMKAVKGRLEHWGKTESKVTLPEAILFLSCHCSRSLMNNMSSPIHTNSSCDQSYTVIFICVRNQFVTIKLTWYQTVTDEWNWILKMWSSACPQRMPNHW